MKKIFLRLPILLVLLSCTGDSPTQTGKTPAIYGTVLDTQGRQVANAKVKVQFEIPQETDGSKPEFDNLQLTNFPNPFHQNVQLRFRVHQQGRVSLEIFRFPDTTVAIATLLKNIPLMAGEHMVNIDALNPADTSETLPNGIYLVRLRRGDSVYSHTMFHQSPMTESGTWVRTDANGKFVLDYKFFPSTGGKIPRIYENGTSPGNCILKDSVTIYIVRPNSGAAIEKLQIDKSKVLEKTFILQ